MLLLGPVTCMHCTGLEVASTHPLLGFKITIYRLLLVGVGVGVGVRVGVGVGVGSGLGWSLNDVSA